MVFGTVILHNWRFVRRVNHRRAVAQRCKCQTPLHGHRLLTCCTIPQQFYNLLYNKFATLQCQIPTSQHVKMLGCGKFLSVGGELLWARPLMMLYNMSVAGKLLYNKFNRLRTYCTTSTKDYNFFWACPLVVPVGGVVQHVRCRSVRVVEFGTVD